MYRAKAAVFLQLASIALAFAASSKDCSELRSRTAGGGEKWRHRLTLETALASRGVAHLLASVIRK